MTRRKRTTMTVLLAVAALFIIAGVAWAAGVFPDVDPGDTHAADIQWAADHGVVNGYTNGNFGPYDPILRGQAATMFKNYDEFAGGGSDGTAGCKDCHNETTMLSGKAAAFGLSVHGAGLEGESAFELAIAEGTNPSCTGCHSGNGFSDRIAAGQDPPEVTAGQTDPTRVDCRACHQIHETYTGADWALETEAPVEFYALPGITFDGGAGNLCANCHQPRVAFPAAVAGMVTIASTRFGPHHGPQSATLVGAGGATTGDPSPHMGVPDTCIGCHMGSDANHLFEPDVARCEGCHAGAEDFDINGVQTYVQMLIDQLKPLLVDAGMLNDTTEAAIAGTYPEAEAAALWNWRDFRIEDKSKGVHNPDYVIGLLTAGIEAFGETPVARP